MLHDYFKEKLLLVTTTIFASAGTAVAAMLSKGDVRWLLVTFTISIFTSVFLAIGFRGPKDSAKKVVSRAGIAVIGGMFLTRYVAHKLGIEFKEDDAIQLAGTAAGVCAASFLIGYPILEIINRKRDDIAKKFLGRYGIDE
jgi:hypothetical protein